MFDFDSIFMDPAIVEQPEKFNPDRFLDESGAFVKPFLSWAPCLYRRTDWKLGAVSVHGELDQNIYIQQKSAKDFWIFGFNTWAQKIYCKDHLITDQKCWTHVIC